MQLASSTSLLTYEHSPMPVELRDVPGARMRIAAFSGSSAVQAEEQVERLADLSDSARRLNRTQQADRFLLLAWLAFDS